MPTPTQGGPPASQAKPTVLLVNQYFWPDRAATAQLLADLACDLQEAGFEVTALASRGTYSAEEARLPAAERWNEVLIRRMPATSLGRGAVWKRLSDYGTYFLGAMLWLVRHRFDIVVCLSTPPLIAMLGLLAKRRGSTFVYKVEDLYPDVAVALGTLEEGSLATRLTRRLSQKILTGASAVVALDGSMANRLRDSGASHVTVIPNWADGEAIYPDPEAGIEFRKRYGLGQELVILYSGNLGLAHRFDAVVTAAERCHAEEEKVRFLFVGGGPRLAEVKAATSRLPNCTFLPYQPREALHALYNAADVHLVTLRDEVAGLLVPSKYSAALAAGKPILFVGPEESEIAREIREENVGWACPHDPIIIHRAIRAARAERLSDTAARARTLFEEGYSRQKAIGRWIELLGSTSSRRQAVTRVPE